MFFEIFFTFAVSNLLILTLMEVAATATRAIPRAKTPIKSLGTRDLGDEYAISLIDEGLRSGRVSREQVMRSLGR